MSLEGFRHRLLDIVFRFTRKRRMRRFEKLLRPSESTTVLDVGGTPLNWRYVAARPCVMLLNLTVPDGAEAAAGQFTFVAGDARTLPYGDQSFDVAFSNSVIEHLGTWQDQQRMAAEVRRVGRQVWVQTPSRWFPIEPHFLAPGIHWLPRGLQRKLLRNFTVWGWLDRPSPAKVSATLAELRLLSRKEMRQLFPDCQIITERFLGLTKCYIAVRR
jgi:hypothetical protein